MLNERIKELRKKKGLTQEELATDLNVVRQTVSKWEKGLSVPDADTLKSIAEVLGVSVEEILDTDSEQTKNHKDIAGQLSKINEQMAIQNRKSLLIWKIISLVLFVLLIFSTLFFVFRLQTTNQTNNTLPDVIEISNVHIGSHKNNLSCSFLSGVGDEGLKYTVTIHSLSAGIQDQTVNAKYENGICTAEFDKKKLIKNIEYSIIFNVNSEYETRNAIVVDSLYIENDGYSWSSSWN